MSIKGVASMMTGMQAYFKAIKTKLNIITENLRSLNNQAISRRVSVMDEPWLAKGDMVADDTEAIQAADIWCAINGYNLYFPRGNYRITSGIKSYVDWEGDGAANISTYNLTDDKIFLVDGKRDKLPGSNIIFDGVATDVFTTSRDDEFGSMRYAVIKVGRSQYRASPGARHLGVVANFTYKLPNGTMTTPRNDAQADVDVGILLHNVELKNISNVCLGGYWKKAGIVHFGIDPDNTHLTEVKTMGNVGIAVIGDTTGTNSGLNTVGCFISSNDHHSRSVDPTNEQWGRCAVYIDIPSATGGASRNGISFIGGAITTKTNVVIELGRCGAVNFTDVVFENATQSGSGTGQGQAGGNKRFIGTEYTGDITFVGCRLNAEQITNPGALIDTAPNAVVTRIGTNAGFGFEQWRGRSGLRINTTNGDQTVQFTDTPGSNLTGARIRRTNATKALDILVENNHVFGLGADGITHRRDASSIENVVDGIITIGTPIVRLSGGTKDLHTIQPRGNSNRVTLRLNTVDDQITLKGGTVGNLRIGSDLTLGQFSAVNLIYDGAYWVRET